MTYHSTKTSPPGGLELVGGVGQPIGGPSLEGLPATEMTVAGRLGVTSFMDVGLRLRSDFVAGGELKVRFVDTDRLHVAIAPGMYFSLLAPLFNLVSGLAERLFEIEQLASAFAYEVHVPLLFGVPFDEHVFLIGPKLSLTNWNIRALGDSDNPLAGSSVGQSLIMPGLVVGLDWSQANNVRFLPEINLHFDLDGSVFLHAGVGIVM